MASVIDLNADLGESYGAWTMGDDAAMLAVVTSANVACGFHGGDPRTMRRTIALAVEHGVTIGAHVSYPDLAGFGRRAMDVAPDELVADVLYQLAALDGLCRVAGTHVRYVKAHGALYHRINADPGQAEAFASAVGAFDASIPVLGAAGPLVGALSARGLVAVTEGFVDRAYRADDTLVPRTEPGAALHDTSSVVAQSLDLANRGTMRSLCVHGDTPNAVAHARAVRNALEAAGHSLRPFA